MGDIRETKAERDPIVNVDVNGDLILDVGGAEEMQCFKVCSRTLSRASKVFKTMLRGQSPKSSTGKKRAVSLLELPEDDPRILATLLYIIHAKFGKVPDKVTRNDLFHITILTRKYAMTEVLRPWVRQWTKPFASAFRPLREKGEDEALLWISWELGHIELFKKALGHLQETCKFDGQGKLVDGYGACVEDSDHIKALNIIGS